jgi:hypothetical protein
MPSITVKSVTTSDRHYSVEDTATYADAIRNGSAISETVTTSKGKMDIRTVAQYEAWYLRNDLVADGHFTKKEITSKTTVTDEGVLWEVFSK